MNFSKWSIALLCALLLSNSLRANAETDCTRYIQRADSCFFVGDYKQGALFYDKVLADVQCAKSYHLSNAAEINALAGNPQRAIELLWQRYAQEPEWYANIANNQSFASLKSNPNFQTLQDSLTARQQRIEANYDIPLKNHLQQIAQSDQSIRYQFIAARNSSDTTFMNELLQEMQTIDDENLVVITHILDSCGWIGRDRIGEATQVFWLVIQHADVKTQQKYLPMMRTAAQQGNISLSSVAMTEDRIAIFNGLPQKYGTQLYTDETGHERLCPLENEDKVDVWRAEVGLSPLADYLEMMHATK